MPLASPIDRTPARPRAFAALAASASAGLLACAALLAALGGRVLPAWAAPAGVTRNYPSGSAPCDTTLQACLDGAADGDTILLAAGDYLTDTLVLSHAVSLTGVSSATVSLHAQPGQRVLTVTGPAVTSTVIISGFTLAGGQALGADCPDGCGGAMLITDTAQPRLFNLTFFSNTANLFAGGLYAESGSPLVLDGLAFISNTSAASGAGAMLNDAADLRASLFQDNACTGAGCVGGGLDAEASLTLTGASFVRNTSDSAGGGVFAFGDTTVTGGQFLDNHCYGPLCSGGGLDVEFNLVMSGTRFVSNTSTSEGGGAFVFIGSVVTNTVFIGNQSLDGGGLYQCEGGGWGDYVNDLFAGNTATEDGDALYIGSPAGAAVRFNTIAGPGLGAAIYVSNGAVGITDTLVASASLGFEADTGSLLDDHNLFSAVTTPYSGAVISTGHSLTATIVFSNPAANDYHLLRGSPAIDAGVDAGIPVDIDGQPRPLLGGFDIGYDEYPLWSVLLPLLRRYL